MSDSKSETDRLFDELFGPPPRIEQKTRDLTLFNPWTQMYHLYRLDVQGLKHYRIFGPLGVRDANRIKKAYRHEE